MKSLLSTIVRYQIAEVQFVPPIIIRLVRDPIVSSYDLSCIKRFASGAAPISAEVLSLLQEKFPGRGFKQGYGMTESTGCITTHPLDRHGFEYARTGGTLVANTVVKVVDDEGRVVGVGEKGEVSTHSTRGKLTDVARFWPKVPRSYLDISTTQKPPQKPLTAKDF
jgi:4-coumarate--CoA ligase